MEKRTRRFSKTLRKYSNPELAQKMAYRYFGKTAKIYPSSNREKKYDIYDPQHKTWVHLTLERFCGKSDSRKILW